MAITFRFSRTVLTEEVYSVEMSDSMPNEDVAKRILIRALAEGKQSDNIKLLQRKATKESKVQSWK